MGTVGRVSNMGDLSLNEELIEDYGSALSFDGVDDYARFTFNIPGFGAIGGFELMLTVPENYSASSTAYVLSSKTSVRTYLQITGDGKIRVMIGDSPVRSIYAYDLDDGKAHRMSMFWDNSVAYFYVDGVIIGSGSYGSLSNSSYFAIGAHYAPQQYGECRVDDVRQWNIARTQQEIQDNMYHTLVGNETGLVGYWKFDEGEGSTAYDSTSNGNDGTIYGATWVDDSGLSSLNVDDEGNLSIAEFSEVEDALSFDGVDDYVDCGTGVSPSTSITLEAWVYQKTTAGNAVDFIFGKGNTSGKGFWIGVFASGKPGFSLSTQLQSDSKTIPLNEWHHIAGTWDGVTRKIYLDGILVGSIADSSSSIDYTGITNMYTGNVVGTGGSRTWDGFIDDVRIWNVARTQSEIQANMNRQLIGDESGLVGYWKFNEGGGSVAKDSSPNGNDGTINGATWVYKSDGVVSINNQKKMTIQGELTEGVSM